MYERLDAEYNRTYSADALTVSCWIVEYLFERDAEAATRWLADDETTYEGVSPRAYFS